MVGECLLRHIENSAVAAGAYLEHVGTNSLEYSQHPRIALACLWDSSRAREWNWHILEMLWNFADGTGAALDDFE
eukprot:4606045-Pyramimonas_sp.AAC.1